MKKLLFILFICFYMYASGNRLYGIAQTETGQTVNDQLGDGPVVAVTGTGNDAMLEREGRTLISGKVDWAKEGKYEVKYYDHASETFLFRTVRIIGENNLDDGISFFEDELHDVRTEDTSARDFIRAGDNAWFVVGTIISDDVPAHTLLPQEYVFVCYYKNGVREWEKIFDEAYSLVGGAIRSAYGIVIAIAYETGISSDADVIEITESGKILRRKTIRGNSYDRTVALGIVENDIYVFILSESTEGDISALYPGMLFLAVVKIDYHSFEIEAVGRYGNEGHVMVQSVFFDKDALYFILIMSANGGEFRNPQGGHSGYFLVAADYTLKSFNYMHLVPEGNPFAMYRENDDSVIVGSKWENGNAYLTFTAISQDLKKVKSWDWKYPGPENINFISVDADREGKIAIIINVWSQALKAVKFAGVMFPAEPDIFCTENNGRLMAVKIMWGDSGKLTVAGGNGRLLWVSTAAYLKSTVTENQTVNQYQIKKSTVILNTYDIGKLGESKEDNLLFGIHNRPYSLEKGWITIILKNTFYVSDKITVRNNEIYNVGLRLYFNGSATLNHRPIEPGDAVTDEGEYILIVTGTENERKIINFTVERLTPEAKTGEAIDISGETRLEKDGYSKGTRGITETESGSVSEDPLKLVTAGIIVSVLTGISLIVPVGRKRKNV